VVLGGLTFVGGVIGYAAHIDRVDEKRAVERLQADRRNHAVAIGDSYSRVLQRQGAPDSVEVEDGQTTLMYWDGYLGPSSISKRFTIGSDSTLKFIEFFGEPYSSIEFSWVPEDSVVVGTPAAAVRERLGTPCLEIVNPDITHMLFQTELGGVARYVGLRNGKGVVASHGWAPVRCPDGE
jgi:hypothetical protein